MNTKKTSSKLSIVEELVADESLSEFRQAYLHSEAFQRSPLHESMRHRIAEEINKTSTLLPNPQKKKSPLNDSV